MRTRPAATANSPSSSLRLRHARFEDVPEILRLIRRAVEHGCRDHYAPPQRREVCASYERSLFVEVIGPCETIVAERDGALAGVAQLDLAAGRLRALFVDATAQRAGVGRALLAKVEERATRRGCVRLHGAMSLNAVPFYVKAGFRPCPGPERLAATDVDVAVPVVRMEKRLRPPRL
jgi:GNAT superfamily N-acetyltransferase